MILWLHTNSDICTYIVMTIVYQSNVFFPQCYCIFLFGRKMFAYWSHKYAHISETVHLRHFMTGGWISLSLYCLRFGIFIFDLEWPLEVKWRSNGKNHARWFYTFYLNFVCIRMSVRTLNINITNFNNKYFYSVNTVYRYGYNVVP